MALTILSFLLDKSGSVSSTATRRRPQGRMFEPLAYIQIMLITLSSPHLKPAQHVVYQPQREGSLFTAGIVSPVCPPSPCNLPSIPMAALPALGKLNGATASDPPGPVERSGRRLKSIAPAWSCR